LAKKDSTPLAANDFNIGLRRLSSQKKRPNYSFELGRPANSLPLACTDSMPRRHPVGLFKIAQRGRNTQSTITTSFQRLVPFQVSHRLGAARAFEREARESRLRNVRKVRKRMSNSEQFSVFVNITVGTEKSVPRGVGRRCKSGPQNLVCRRLSCSVVG
jgi:hypothetical protein